MDIRDFRIRNVSIHVRKPGGDTGYIDINGRTYDADLRRLRRMLGFMNGHNPEVLEWIDVWEWRYTVIGRA